MILNWDEFIIPVFFLYGLAFYSMGLALLVESGRASEFRFARSMRLLAGFGLLHGAHEWLDLLEHGLHLYGDASLPIWLDWFMVALLATSFIALLAFSEHLYLMGTGRSWFRWRITIAICIWYAASCVIVNVVYRLTEPDWITACEVLARYILGIPSGAFACWVIWRQRESFEAQGMERFSWYLTVGAVALAVYGIVGQYFSPSSVVFPSMFINDTLFLQLTGFPVQVFRAAMAIIVAVSMIRVLRAFELESQQRLESIERARYEAERYSHEKLARLNAELQERNDETQRLLKELEKRDFLRGEFLQQITAAQESERKRIARELHDGTGQMLTGLALGLRGLSAQKVHDAARMSRLLSQLETMATNALGELRLLINDLRPPQLDDMGLVAALRAMIDRFKDSSHLSINLEVQGEAFPLASEIETILFRIAQEGLTNITKHAHAEHAWIILDYTEGLTLTVQDDGEGFDAEAVLEPTNGLRSAWGLVGIQERTNLINAELTLQSAPGDGTTLIVRLPASAIREVKSDH